MTLPLIPKTRNSGFAVRTWMGFNGIAYIPIVCRKNDEEHGEYRTKHVTLEIYAKAACGGRAELSGRSNDESGDRN